MQWKDGWKVLLNIHCDTGWGRSGDCGIGENGRAADFGGRVKG